VLYFCPLLCQCLSCILASYNSSISGPSGNITVNGVLTCGATSTGNASSNSNVFLEQRGIGAGGQTGVDLNTPPYAIHNGKHRSYSTSFASLSLFYIYAFPLTASIFLVFRQRPPLPPHPRHERNPRWRNRRARRA
jgi:hypothetical protein